MNDPRLCSYREYGEHHGGKCHLITGGMMSPPVAVIEREDGTLTEIPIADVQLITEQFMPLVNK